VGVQRVKAKQERQEGMKLDIAKMVSDQKAIEAVNGVTRDPSPK
jgi:hypothetical protein